MFRQIWKIKSLRQTAPQTERRIAAFPDELANRLVKTLGFKGDTVLDPFLGSRKRTKIALENARNSVSYKSDESLLPLIKQKINHGEKTAKLLLTKRQGNSSEKKL